MIGRDRRLSWTASLLALVLATTAAWTVAPGVRADDGTPVPPTAILEPTVATTPTAAPESSATPTVVVFQERPKPSATAPATPMSTPLPAPVATSLPTPFAVPTLTTVPTSTPTPLPLTAPTAVVAPAPSPADLRQNARLRWGKRVPRAVRRWAFLIVPAARKYHLSPSLIAAVMTLESGGDPLAWNQGSDARGLMQVLHGAWGPAANIDEGARMLAEFYSQFGNWTLTLAAYNAGPNAVLSYNGVPPYRETQDYVVVVNYLWDLYNHHKLTVKRKLVYHSTLRDLERFAKDRAKVKKLIQMSGARSGAISGAQSNPQLTCADPSCGNPVSTAFFPTLDPYWPVGNVPDPLQRVDPYVPPL